MAPRARRSIYVGTGLVLFAAASFFIFRGYLTPEMMVYFLSFQWCF